MIIPLYIERSDKMRICESRLAADINATTGVLTVTTGEGATNFPSYTPFLLQIESEAVNVTKVSTDTFTIERGEWDTTATSHTAGTPLRAVIYSEDLGGEYVKMVELAQAQETLLKQITEQLKAILAVVAYGQNLSNKEEDYN